jgi:hypothetical protein
LGLNAVIDLSQAGFRFAGDRRNQYVGHAVSDAGDVDGDGLDDIVVGAWYGPTWRGAAYVITGESAGNIGCEWGDLPQ